MKKFNNKSNVIGNLINQYRENQQLSKGTLSRKLELLGVNLDTTEICRIETGRMIVKDFELIALCKVLNIDYDELMKTIED